jgi:hypothetical protein
VEAPAALQASQGLVHGDACQPGGEERFAAKAGELAIGAHVALLHDVLGLRSVAQDAARDAEEALVVTPHQELEESRFAGQNAADDLHVAQRLELAGSRHR